MFLCPDFVRFIFMPQVYVGKSNHSREIKNSWWAEISKAQETVSIDFTPLCLTGLWTDQTTESVRLVVLNLSKQSIRHKCFTGNMSNLAEVGRRTTGFLSLTLVSRYFNDYLDLITKSCRHHVAPLSRGFRAITGIYICCSFSVHSSESVSFYRANIPKELRDIHTPA